MQVKNVPSIVKIPPGEYLEVKAFINMQTKNRPNNIAYLLQIENDVCLQANRIDIHIKITNTI